MKPKDELEEMIKSYRTTVLVLSIVIVGIFCLFAYIVLWFVPNAIADTVKPAVKEAMAEALADYDINP